MATGQNRQESRNRAQARNRLRARGSGKKRRLSVEKRWLSGAGTGIAAGLLMGLMGSVIFFTRGLYAFQQGADDVGIGYMVLTALFPVVMVTAGWWMGRGTDPRKWGTD